jgi:bifunctional non-homologous end joining protein LigD
MSGLDDYKQKRRFGRTPEPKPEKGRSDSGRLFVVQKHRASQLHYDFRLEDRGVLKSWAIPKGPSLDPTVKRLAMAVEDHPLDYAQFEGVIPEGEYGGGTVMIWDRGAYEPEGTDDIEAALRKGELKFVLTGSKLKGSWVLVRTRSNQWLLIKHRDRHASTDDVAVSQPTSIATGRTLAEIAADEGGNAEKAATGDPPDSRRSGVKDTRHAQRKAGPPAPAKKTLRE